MKIFKYEINPYKPSSIVHIPRGGKILSAKHIRDKVCVYALVNPDRPIEDREILSWITGKETPKGLEGAKFIDTFLLFKEEVQ